MFQMLSFSYIFTSFLNTKYYSKYRKKLATVNNDFYNIFILRFNSFILKNAYKSNKKEKLL